MAYKVIVDAGHGGRDPGAVYQGRNEKDDALDLAMELKGTPVESIRMPIDGTYEPMPVAGMATQQIDFVKNREALWSFFLDSFVVVDE